ncbi:hypothetical protein KK423_01355 [Clostridioides difficile]|nr:hypothetical protein [Clostridioides difficile]
MEDELSEAILKGNVKKGSNVVAKVKDEKIVLKLNNLIELHFKILQI